MINLFLFVRDIYIYLTLFVSYMCNLDLDLLSIIRTICVTFRIVLFWLQPAIKHFMIYLTLAFKYIYILNIHTYI